MMAPWIGGQWAQSFIPAEATVHSG